jgi:alcohol dehydrogenase class IV
VPDVQYVDQMPQGLGGHKMAYFRSPKILFGRDMLRKLALEIEGVGRRASIITDETMVKDVDPLVGTMKDAGVMVDVWDGAKPEPWLEIASTASEALRNFDPQIIVAFGGGSVIDTAKAAWVLYACPDIKAAELEKKVNPKARLNLRNKARFVAVPTTSGTGSEVTWAVLLTDKANKRKIPFVNNEIVPDIALLVPEFTVGMPKELTSGTGMDVLGHALDGYTSRQQNDFSDGLCVRAVELCFNWLPRAYENGEDLEAREKMQNAAALAGLGFGNSNTSLSHALAHSLGVSLGIPHGRAVALCLTPSLRYLSSHSPVAKVMDPAIRISGLARIVGICPSSYQDGAKAFIDKIDELRNKINAPLNLKDIGISKEQFEGILETLVLQAGKDVNMFSSPCECKGDDLKEVFRNIWSGSDGD